jgi:hypothetical protein
MHRTAIAIFEPITATTLRMVVLEVEDGGKSVIEIAEIDTDQPRNANLALLTRFVENSGLEFEMGYRAHWDVSLGRARLTRSRIGKIIDAYPGIDACGEARDIGDPLVDTTERVPF